MLLRCKSLPRAASGHSVDTEADGSCKPKEAREGSPFLPGSRSDSLGTSYFVLR